MGTSAGLEARARAPGGAGAGAAQFQWCHQDRSIQKLNAHKCRTRPKWRSDAARLARVERWQDAAAGAMSRGRQHWQAPPVRSAPDASGHEPARSWRLGSPMPKRFREMDSQPYTMHSYLATAPKPSSHPPVPAPARPLLRAGCGSSSRRRRAPGRAPRRRCRGPPPTACRAAAPWPQGRRARPERACLARKIRP